MKPIEDTTKHWTAVASKLLVGRKITKARYMTDKECEAFGWDRKAVVLQLDDGNIIYPSQDDEGNGAGAMFTNDDKTPILPVLR